MNEWIHYIHELHQLSQTNAQKIGELENRCNELERQLQDNQKNTIEKVEYHFDQLKIEQLDGTLHIGLTPNDLGNIKDLDVPLNNMQHNASKSNLNAQLLYDLRNHLYEVGPQIVRNLSDEYRLPIDEGFQTFLIQDIEKQLPNRIAFYIEKAKENDELANDQDIHRYIMEQIKNEISHSLTNYLKNNYHKGAN